MLGSQHSHRHIRVANIGI
ncbi:hypothetical protein CEXT_412491, partial [Caerostris extrusa]